MAAKQQNQLKFVDYFIFICYAPNKKNQLLDNHVLTLATVDTKITRNFYAWPHIAYTDDR